MSCFDLLGCFSFLRALASICLILSLVTENCKPTSSRVWSVFIPTPNLILKTLSSLGVNVDKIFVVASLKFDFTAWSNGSKAFVSSIKSPKLLSSSSPTGFSNETGSLEIFKTFLTLSMAFLIF